jgi:hypothetical protein
LVSPELDRLTKPSSQNKRKITAKQEKVFNIYRLCLFNENTEIRKSWSER